MCMSYAHSIKVHAIVECCINSMSKFDLLDSFTVKLFGNKLIFAALCIVQISSSDIHVLSFFLIIHCYFVLINETRTGKTISIMEYILLDGTCI